jgi:hypothetical protein
LSPASVFAAAVIAFAASQHRCAAMASAAPIPALQLVLSQVPQLAPWRKNPSL